VITAIKDLVGFTPYTPSFSGISSEDDGSITKYQWYIDDVEQTQSSTFSQQISISGRYTIKLVVTDQDNQTDAATVKVDVVDDGQAARNCDSSLVFMAERLWTPFFSKCAGCHSTNPEFKIISSGDTFLTENDNEISKAIESSADNIREKAQGIGHPGGTVVPESETSVYDDLEELVNRILTPPSACP
jgi:hypothetical protein